jgi:hypothetical protein
VPGRTQPALLAARPGSERAAAPCTGARAACGHARVMHAASTCGGAATRIGVCGGGGGACRAPHPPAACARARPPSPRLPWSRSSPVATRQVQRLRVTPGHAARARSWCCTRRARARTCNTPLCRSRRG